MAVKKSELYSTLWKCCDELRGGMDASQYKDYVLVILFVKYISDKSRSDEGFDIDIPEGCYFEDFVALKGNPNIGEEMNKKMAALAEANQLDGVFVADFEDDAKLGKGKDKVETLSKLIAVFQNENLDFSKNRAADDDLIGDAYEYLMKNFATESGKSKGQFYTPAEVSRVMAKVIGLGDARNGKKTTIYDPTCGSGSLLLRAMCETPDGATIYGQEKDNATVGLAKMNMILHNEIYADIKQGDTINDPQFKDDDQLKTFDYIVANPPFSTKSWLKSAKTEDEYHRWGEGIKIGVPPEKNGDYAFLLHIVRSLKQTGCAACILPHGVLFRGNAEAQIRKYLVAEKRYIKGIIGLPANLFYGMGIPACIIIVEKSEAVGRKGVFMIDAKSGYIKDGAKNRLREQDIRRIVDVWQAQRDVPHYARFVPMEEIERNDYNLNIPRYVFAPDTEILQDIDAHLHGGLPKHDIDQFDAYWEVCPSLRDDLFCDHPTRKGYYSLKCKLDAVRDVVDENIDFRKQKGTKPIVKTDRNEVDSVRLPASPATTKYDTSTPLERRPDSGFLSVRNLKQRQAVPLFVPDRKGLPVTAFVHEMNVKTHRADRGQLLDGQHIEHHVDIAHRIDVTVEVDVAVNHPVFGNMLRNDPRHFARLFGRRRSIHNRIGAGADDRIEIDRLAGTQVDDAPLRHGPPELPAGGIVQREITGREHPVVLVHPRHDFIRAVLFGAVVDLDRHA